MLQGTFGNETDIKDYGKQRCAEPRRWLGRRETGYLSPDGWFQSVAWNLFLVEMRPFFSMINNTVNGDAEMIPGVVVFDSHTSQTVRPRNSIASKHTTNGYSNSHVLAS